MTDKVAKPEAVDITSEQYRLYTYAGGSTFRINNPDRLFVMPGGSHRVIDGDGITHRPATGWLAVSWKPKAGAPEFIA